MWLFLLFLAVPLMEIALFITIGGWLTLWPTLGLVLLTGIIGTALVRWQGLKVLAELRGDMGQMRNPLSPLVHGALVLVAGILLLTPGFFTDTIGFLLLVPALRTWIIAQIGARVQVQSFGAQAGFGAPHGFDDANGFDGTDARRNPPNPGVIDGDFIEIDDNNPPRSPSGWTRH